MLVFVSLTFLLFLILQCRANFLNENGKNFIQRVHHSPLQPLGNCSPGMVESQLLQDVVHPHRIDLTARPRDQPETYHVKLIHYRHQMHEKFELC